MNFNQNLVLIDGEFAPADAKEILKNVFSSKIQFHEMRNFSLKERFGKKDEAAIKRISELQMTLEKILQIVSEAETSNEALTIKAEISIQKSELKSETRSITKALS